MNPYAYRIVVGIVLCSLAGCGDGKSDVHGNVSYSGAVLNKPGGMIIFVGDQGEQIKADIDSSGGYTMAGVPAGHYRVVVYYPSQVTPTGKRLPKKGESVPPSPASPFLTPVKYTAAATSGLEVEVKGSTVYNVDMVGPPIP